MAKEKKPSADKSASKAKTTKAKENAPSEATPAIDTTLAAQNAAAMLVRLGSGATGAKNSDQPKSESSAFKQMKDSINKPTFGTAGGAFGHQATSKKSAQSGGPMKQTGRNQTFGADASKAFVPRRTGGG